MNNLNLSINSKLKDPFLLIPKELIVKDLKVLKIMRWLHSFIFDAIYETEFDTHILNMRCSDITIKSLGRNLFYPNDSYNQLGVTQVKKIPYYVPIEMENEYFVKVKCKKNCFKFNIKPHHKKVKYPTRFIYFCREIYPLFKKLKPFKNISQNTSKVV